MDLFNSYLLLLFFNSFGLLFAKFDRQNCPTRVQSSRQFVATHDDMCYMFVNSEKYWDEARSYCWSIGGEMLYVENQKTMDFIKEVLNSRDLGWSNNGVWNGASDLRSKGWEWTTGKALGYTYWAHGEPSKLLGILSVENCACMRRHDNWRWHDFHCHSFGLEYNFICQFPMVHKETYTGSQVKSGAPLLVERDDRVAVIGLTVAGVALLIIICAVVYFLYMKHERQKIELQKRNQRVAMRLQNTGYATIMQNVSHDRSHDNSSTDMSQSVTQPSTRPVSNIYLDPVEVNRVYDEVNKDSTFETRNLMSSNSDGHNVSGVAETTPLVYTGGASSAGNLAAAGSIGNVQSEASGATSGYCPSRRGRTTEENEYIEMSGGESMGDVSRSPRTSLDNLKKCTGGATGSVHDLKSSNTYITPVFSCNKLNNETPVEKSKSPEIHIYSNRLEEIDNNSSLGLRPLPPVPNMDSNIPSDKPVL